MLSMFKQLWKDEEGPTAVEYALMVALIAVAIVGAVEALSGAVSRTFTNVAGEMPAAGN